MSEEVQTAIALDKVSYTESRAINIGDYESIKCHLTFTTSFVPINNTETRVQFYETESALVHPSETYEQAAKRVVAKVKKVLDSREMTIRRRSADHVEFNTEGKADDLIGAKTTKKKVRKKKSRDIGEAVRIDDEDEIVV